MAARVSPARSVALALVSERRRRAGRMRELLRSSHELERLGSHDKALAFRLAMGATATQALADELLDERLNRSGSIEPRVRDALRISCFEICWLATPERAAVSQGVELVRSVSPRAAGLANAVLRRLAHEVRPQVVEARARCAGAAMGSCSASVRDLVLVSGLTSWLVKTLLKDRGLQAAATLCSGILEPAPVYVAANRMLHTHEETRELLAATGLEPQDGPLPGSFVLASPAGLASSGLVEATDVVVADAASQLVVWHVAPEPGARVLEVGQGRATKTLLLESCALARGGLVRIVGVDSEAFKTHVARRRVEAAGLAECVECMTLDARLLGSDGLPAPLRQSFDVVFLDAPCSGSGTLRRHPEIAASLERDAVDPACEGSLPSAQLALLEAASSRVKPCGMLAYATCSALRAEDERVVAAFLASDAGRRFTHVPISSKHATQEGFLLTGLVQDEEKPLLMDTHFLALLKAHS